VLFGCRPPSDEELEEGEEFLSRFTEFLRREAEPKLQEKQA
jgi:hypothetical protein